MKISLLLVVSACITCNCHATNHYDYEVFVNQIDGRCLSRLWSNPWGPKDVKPERLTMEYFADLVQKVEENHPTWDLYQTSRALLKRFAFEEIVFRTVIGERVPVLMDAYKRTWDIMSKLVPEEQQTQAIAESDLTENEKCSMFFMMGHLVNETSARTPISDPNDPLHTKYSTLEQGVLNVRNSWVEAVSVSKILNGILASRTQELLVDQLFDIKNSKFPKSLKVIPLIGVTLGDVLSRASLRQQTGTSGLSFFGSGGVWNNNTNPTEYRTNGKPGEVTNALLRGAVDGVLISYALNSSASSENKTEPRLSSILRQYYSRQGITERKTSPAVSYCRRHRLGSFVTLKDIESSVFAYYNLLVYKEHTLVLENAREKVREVVWEMVKALEDMKKQTAADCPKEEVIEPDSSLLVGPVSKATLFCSKSVSDPNVVGQVTASGCKVLCSTVINSNLYNVPNGLTCEDGKGTCQNGACQKK